MLALLIEPVACTPASGWEKGQVENHVGYALDPETDRALEAFAGTVSNPTPEPYYDRTLLIDRLAGAH